MKSLKITATVLVTILSLASCESENIMPNNELNPTTEFAINENYNTLSPRDPDMIPIKQSTEQTIENNAPKLEEAQATADRRSLNK
jgi:PBP1b-binding outer membrane lipoprotein LpoB